MFYFIKGFSKAHKKNGTIFLILFLYWKAIGQQDLLKQCGTSDFLWTSDVGCFC